MNIGSLNRRVDVLERIEQRDEYGAVTGEWVTVGRVWANIKPKNGSEIFMNKQVSAEQNYIITVRFYPQLSALHRIRYKDKLFEITAVADIHTNHRWTEITAKELIDGNIQCETEES